MPVLRFLWNVDYIWPHYTKTQDTLNFTSLYGAYRVFLFCFVFSPEGDACPGHSLASSSRLREKAMTRNQELSGQKLSRGTHGNSVRKESKPGIWKGLEEGGVQAWQGRSYDRRAGGL